MTDWRRYWEDRAREFSGDERRQVGRTRSGGVPTPEPEIRLAVDEVVARLALAPEDRLLDLCCGNGLLTDALVDRCRAVVGVDFSATMIEAARQRFGARATWVRASVLDLSPAALEGPAAFTAVSMFESLQYFEPSDLPTILAGIRSVAAPGVRVVFSGVLDRSRWDSFFDTPERRAEAERRRREGTDLMGTWWSAEDLARVADAAGFSCSIHQQDARLNTAHYRFDARFVDRRSV